jgi:hypothetical protein
MVVAADLFLVAHTSIARQGTDGTNRNEGSLPPLNSLINLDDFEQVAEKNLAVNAWAYYSSAAEDEITKDENRHAFSFIVMGGFCFVSRNS